MWKKVGKYALPLLICLVMVGLMVPVVTSCSSSGGAAAPTEIVIGASRDITGPQAGFQQFGFAAIYKMWINDVNNAGGIDVGGKKLKVRLIEYDDASDTSVCVNNIEKLCTQDHVNFLFGPTGTAMLFAAAPIANKYQTMMICGEGGATTLEPQLAKMPYVFCGSELLQPLPVTHVHRPYQRKRRQDGLYLLHERPAWRGIQPYHAE